MQPTNHTARVAAALYLLMGIPAVFTLIYVPRVLMVRGDAAATASHIRASEMLFRAGMVAHILSGIAFIFCVMALHRLLNEVSKTQASLMVNLVLVSATIEFVNVLNNIAALTLFRGGSLLGTFDQHQLDELGTLFLGLHRQGLVVNEMFWGLWLFPFGILVYRSRFLPRPLGLWLVLNGLAYVAMSLAGLLFPQYERVVSIVVLPALLGEIAIVLWLLFKGINSRPLQAGITSPATG